MIAGTVQAFQSGTAFYPDQLVPQTQSLNSGTFGDATHIPVVTVGAGGQITNITTIASSPSGGFFYPYTTSGATGGTTQLTSSSTYYQYFTGSGTQTVKLPSTATLAVGNTYVIRALPTASFVNLQTFDATGMGTVNPGAEAVCTCVSTSLDNASGWDVRIIGSGDNAKLGAGAYANLNGSTALGGSSNSGSGATAVGFQAIASGTNDIALGKGTNTALANINQVAIGAAATTAANNAIAIGNSADATGSVSIAIGNTASASVSGGIALGGGATADNVLYPVALGVNTSGVKTWSAGLALGIDLNGSEVHIPITQASDPSVLTFSGQSIAQAGGITTLVALDSPAVTVFTGAGGQTCRLPTTTVVGIGQMIRIYNLGSGVVTVQDNDANAVTTVAAGAAKEFVCVITGPDAAANWFPSTL